MAKILWGINPKTKKAECYALWVTPDDEEEYLEAAKAEGWTKLVLANRSKSPDGDEDE